jgi:hypothetical protein
VISALLAVLLAVPTPSPTLSPLPTRVVNWYADQGATVSGLDPALVRAIIDAESAGDPHAVSPAGAVGMMQLEPATASDCGVSDAFDPAANVACGSRTLARLVNRYGLETGIAAYNFGPGAVESVGGHLDKMPLETQRYVFRVVTDYDALQHQTLAVAVPTSSPLPLLPPSAFDKPLATPAPLPTISVAPAKPCSNVGWLAVGASQVTNALVVSNAIAHGSVGQTAFGSSRSAAPYVGESLLLDGIAWLATHRAPCGVQYGAQGLLFGSALYNTTQTRFPK